MYARVLQYRHDEKYQDQNSPDISPQRHLAEAICVEVELVVGKLLKVGTDSMELLKGFASGAVLDESLRC